MCVFVNHFEGEFIASVLFRSCFTFFCIFFLLLEISRSIYYQNVLNFTLKMLAAFLFACEIGNTPTHTQHTHSRIDTSGHWEYFCNFFSLPQVRFWNNASFFLIYQKFIGFKFSFVFLFVRTICRRIRNKFIDSCMQHIEIRYDLFIFVFFKYYSKMFFNVCHCQSRIAKLCTL